MFFVVLSNRVILVRCSITVRLKQLLISSYGTSFVSRMALQCPQIYRKTMSGMLLAL